MLQVIISLSFSSLFTATIALPYAAIHVASLSELITILLI